jgi:excinuclease ABC subunit C
MGSCSGPCIGALTSGEYWRDVKKAESILRGRSKELLETLQEEMTSFSAHQEFEQALQIRDQIRAIQQFPERQHVERQKAYDEDVINYVVQGEKVHMIVFSVYRGTLGEKEEFTFENSDGFLDEFLTQYYTDRTPPKELILPVEVDPSVAEFIAHRLGQQVRITVPQKGDKKALLDLVARNIEIAFFGDRLKLEALRRSLRLPEVPSVIECFDISHLSGTSTVGSMVQFRNGKPSKKNYRRFRIRTVEGVDDVAAIGEVVRRRYGRLAEERGDLPDLVIVDGGKGQLGAAVAEIRELGLAVPVIAIAKRDEEVYIPGHPGPLPLGKKDTASLFIQEIRDEAHRFAITYHRLLRRKKLIET